MKEVFLHIGLHKTGTTFLQEKVFPLFKDITYLTRPYTQHNFAFNKLQYADDSLYCKEDILHELEKINSNRLLISDESFSGKPLNFSYINRSIIAKRLKEIFPDAKIMIFIRGQQELLFSHYSQYVSESGYKSIDQLLWYPSKDYSYDMFIKKENTYKPETLYYNTNEFHLHLDCFLYFELISLYKKLFKNVEVYLYEDFKQKPERVLQSMEAFFEQKVNLYAQIDFQQKVNQGLKPENIQMKRNQNRMRVLADYKLITVPLSMFYKLTSRKAYNFNFEKKYVEKIAQEFYKTNNRKVVHAYPEVGIDHYPDYYSL